MTTKLMPVTTQYSKFVDNQVLTEEQLNGFLEYFEDQDHLTRIGLSGVGIVCGFKVAYDESEDRLVISQGYGVTTDGDLLTLSKPTEDGEADERDIAIEEKVFSHFRIFEDLKVNYSFFDSITLRELFVADEIDTSDTSYSSLSELDMSDKVVLLYLENYAKTGALCDVLDCDNQGIEQVAILRVLLVSEEDARTIASLDSIYTQHDWFQTYLDLPELAIPRVILHAGNTNTLAALKNAYKDAVDQALPDLGLGFDSLLQKLDSTDPGISSDINTVFSMSSSPRDFQYRYDGLRDLVHTYNEIKELLLHIEVECTPDIDSFPKHLLLGKVMEAGLYPSLRHRFYKSPIVGHENANLKKLHRLIARARNILRTYHNPEYRELRITPSRMHARLTEKSIPFYYNPDDEFLASWSHMRSTNFLQANNLGYHIASLSADAHIQNPLEYDFSSYDFFRIEGGLGRPYTDVEQEIKQIVRQKGLSFDVKSLALGTFDGDITWQDFPCEFNDLKQMILSTFWDIFCTIFMIYGMRKWYVLGAESGLMGMSGTGNGSDSEASWNKGPIGTPQENLMTYLYEDPEGLGGYIKQVVGKKKNPCGGDIYKDTIREWERSQKKDGKKIKENSELELIKDDLEIITMAYDLDQQAPRKLDELDQQGLFNLQKSAEGLTAKLQETQLKNYTQYRDPRRPMALSSMMCCLAKMLCAIIKLLFLYAEYQRRINAIKSNLELSGFLSSHPALEHWAGTPEGGTYVLLYNENKEVEADFSLPYRCCSDCLSESASPNSEPIIQ